MAAPAGVAPRRRFTPRREMGRTGLSFENEQEAAFAAPRHFAQPSEMAETRRRAARATEGTGEVWWDPR